VTRQSPTNLAASVRARLLSLSKSRGEDFTLTLVNYGIERFLYRLSRSVRRDQFVLKGAVLLALRAGAHYRPTRDLDLLGRGEASADAVAAAMRDILATVVDDDGLEFDASTIAVAGIREGDRYGGLRVTLLARLASARVPLQIDVGFGDVVTPTVDVVHVPSALATVPAAHVLAYPTPTIVAEKVQAMVDIGLVNSRMKDFFDVAVAANRLTFDGPTLTAALVATFSRRQTAIPEGVPPALADTFAQDRRTQANWTSFVTRSGLENPGTLAQALETIRGFVLAPLAAAHSGASFDKQWAPGGPWR
jgi:uncharacterized protein YggL (DUF469 family)